MLQLFFTSSRATFTTSQKLINDAWINLIQWETRKRIEWANLHPRWWWRNESGANRTIKSFMMSCGMSRKVWIINEVSGSEQVACSMWNLTEGRQHTLMLQSSIVKRLRGWVLQPQSRRVRMKVSKSQLCEHTHIAAESNLLRMRGEEGKCTKTFKVFRLLLLLRFDNFMITKAKDVWRRRARKFFLSFNKQLGASLMSTGWQTHPCRRGRFSESFFLSFGESDYANEKSRNSRGRKSSNYINNFPFVFILFFITLSEIANQVIWNGKAGSNNSPNYCVWSSYRTGLGRQRPIIIEQVSITYQNSNSVAESSFLLPIYCRDHHHHISLTQILL